MWFNNLEEQKNKENSSIKQTNYIILQRTTFSSFS